MEVAAGDRILPADDDLAASSGLTGVHNEAVELLIEVERSFAWFHVSSASDAPTVRWRVD